jgi:hypothetical protein
MSCLTIDVWHDTFKFHADDPGSAGQMASALARVTSIVGDPCYTPERKIILIEKMFDQMALKALEATDGTG